MSVQLLPPPGLVYLLHFDKPYIGAQRKPGAKRQTVRHYIGWTAYDLEQRLEHHSEGKGARIMQVVADAGISFAPVRVWKAGRTFERQLKNQNHSARLCPVCNPVGWASRMEGPQ